MADSGPRIDPDDPVVSQYERWIYPTPVNDLNWVPFNQPSHRYRDLGELAPAYWPARPPRTDIDVLVPGCGSMAAACYAYFYPDARVYGIDVSAATLAHEEMLKNKHGLDNLTLQRLPLEDVGQLGRDFDIIISHGVLHHLTDPVAGLRELGKVLRPDGVMALMVYGRHGRRGVYILQELFRMLGLKQDEEGVRAVREGLAALGPNHPIRYYLKLAAEDLGTDEGIVDTFLHGRDRPYSVTECLDLVQQAGLVFQGWDDNIFYHSDGYLPTGTPFRTRLDALKGPAHWQAIELYYGCMPGHFFHVCRTDRPESTYRIPIGEEPLLDCIPVARARFTRPPEYGPPFGVARPPYPEVGLDPRQAAIFSQIDGKRTIVECVRAAGFDPAEPLMREFAQNFFTCLWRFGYMFFRLRAE